MRPDMQRELVVDALDMRGLDAMRLDRSITTAKNSQPSAVGAQCVDILIPSIGVSGTPPERPDR